MTTDADNAGALDKVTAGEADVLHKYSYEVLRKLPVGVVIAEAPSGRLVMASERLEHILRHKLVRAENIDQYAQYTGFHEGGSLYHPLEWPLARSISTGEVVEAEEIEIIRGDGTTGQISVSSTPVYDGDRIVAAIATVHDVTGKKSLREALEKSEAELARVQKFAHIGSWTWDMDTGLVTLSAEACNILGVKKPLIMSLRWFLSYAHPDDRELVCDEIRDALSGKKPFACHYRIARGDGPARIVHARGEVVFNGEGKPARLLATLHDVTQCKTIEDQLGVADARFKVLVNSSIIGIFFANANAIVDANDAFLRIIGYSREDMLSGQIDWRGITPADYAEFDSQMTVDFIRNGVCAPYEKEYVRNDGSRIPVMVGGALLEKEPMMWVCFVVDITAQKNIERERKMLLRQLSQEQQRLQDANAWAELYLDIMAHDINSTNQTSMSYLELAMESLGPDSPEYEYLRYSLEAVNNSTKLIESVRKLQRVKNSSEPESVDIGQVLQEVKSGFISSPGREVFIDYTPAAGYLVKANPLLKDVFNNVIGYSFKHSDNDRPLAIGISLAKAYEGGQVYCKIIIEDNASGMPDDAKGKVFTTFTRDNVRSKISGIGLYLVRTIIEEFKGRVWVEDRIAGDYTKGSRFVIMLPAIEK